MSTTGRRSTIGGRRSSTFGGHLANAGILGESFAEKQGLQVSENRMARRRRTSNLRIDQEESLVGVIGSVPNEAYSSSCPVHQVANGCTGEVKRQQLPEQCRHSALCQGLFGNVVDLRVREREADGNTAGGALQSGMKLGLTTLEAAGWVPVETPSVINELSNDRDKEHFFMALRLIGLTVVNRPDDEEKMMATFKKGEIPGTAAEVKHLIKTLEKIVHINVVKFKQACEDEENVYFLYEAMDGAGLLPMMVDTNHEVLEPADTAKVIQQVAAATDACLHLGLFHWDWSLWHLMSPSYANVNPVKIFGFGLAGVMHSGKRSEVPEVARSLRGGFYCVSPEIAQLQLTQSDSHNIYKRMEMSMKEPSDVWSIGVIAYILLTGHPPFCGADETTVLQKIASSAKIAFDAEFAHVEADGITFFETLLAKDNKQRPQVQAIVTANWIMKKSLDKARAGAGAMDPRFVIDRLTAYVNLDPVMRSLGKLFVQGLREEKMKRIEEAYQLLDIKGNGTLDVHELSSIVTEKRHDIMNIFKALEQMGRPLLSASEFVLANAFAEEVLTERLLRVTFNGLDLDGRGSVSPEEIFKELKKIDPNVHASDILRFMGNADQSWDLELDFEEFLQFFPQVPNRVAFFNARHLRAEKRQKVAWETFETLKDKVENWNVELESEIEKLQALKAENSEDPKLFGEPKSAKKVNKIIKSLYQLMKKELPSVHLSETSEETLLEGIRHRKKSSPLFTGSGALALATFLEYHSSGWQGDFMFLKDRGEVILNEKSRNRRAVELDDIVATTVPKLQVICKWTRWNIEEQRDMLEAADMNEGTVPEIPLCARGGGIAQEDEEEDEATIEIREYQKQRAKELEALETAGADPKNRKRSTVMGRKSGSTLGMTRQGSMLGMQRQGSMLGTQNTNLMGA